MSTRVGEIRGNRRGNFFVRRQRDRRQERIVARVDQQRWNLNSLEPRLAGRSRPVVVGGFRCLLTGHRPGTEDFVFAERFEGGGGDGSDGNGVADGVEDLDGIAFRAVRRDVVVHELDDIAPFEAMFRYIARKHGVGVERLLRPCLRLFNPFRVYRCPTFRGFYGSRINVNDLATL